MIVGIFLLGEKYYFIDSPNSHKNVFQLQPFNNHLPDSTNQAILFYTFPMKIHLNVTYFLLRI